MDGKRSGGRAGRKRARTGAMKAAVTLVLLSAPHIPSAEALKLESISEERGHLGVGLLRAVEVVRGRYERAWALVSASEPSAEDLDIALELLQENAKQWESLEPAVKLWAERENEGPQQLSPSDSNQSRESSSTPSSSSSESSKTAATATTAGEENSGNNAHQDGGSGGGSPGVSDTTSRIYDEAASLLAHNRAVLGQALARSGQADRGIAELEIACPEIMEYQQNAHGRRDSKTWLHCFANLAEMYTDQQRFDDVSNLFAKIPWLPANQQQAGSDAEEEVRGQAAAETARNAPPLSGTGLDGDKAMSSSVLGDVDAAVTGSGTPSASVTVARADDAEEMSPGDISTSTSLGGAGVDACPHEKNAVGGRENDENHSASSPSSTEAASNASDSSSANASSGNNASSKGGRSEASPPAARGAGAARIAGLNKAAVAASAAAAVAAAESLAAGAVETGAEAEARALVEQHAEAMRASMNELVGELAVTTATRPTASQDWLDSRVVAAEEVLAAVRAGLLSAVSPTFPDGQPPISASRTGDAAAKVPPLPVGVLGHADILREASHYLSAIKGVAAQGWAYVDNELLRMERHPAQAVKPGFQSRREVIHTFRYLLTKARQYASENQNQAAVGSGAASQGSSPSSRWRRKDRGRKASASSKAPRKPSAARKSSSSSRSSQSGGSDSSSSSKETGGFYTLFFGAGFALLVAAFSSGRGGGQGRRREVVRQRTATRAAKTVGSYVEPPQRSAVAGLLFHAWGNLKRSGLLISVHATNSASLARSFIFFAWAAALERLQAVRDSPFKLRRDSSGKSLTASGVPKKKASGGSQGHHKQRSKKNVKKAAEPNTLSAGAAVVAPPPVLRHTIAATPPVSPPTSIPPRPSKEPPKQHSDIVAPAAAVVTAALASPSAETLCSNNFSSKPVSSTSGAVSASQSQSVEVAEAGKGFATAGIAKDAVPASSADAKNTTVTAAAVARSKVATSVAAEMTAAGVSFPDVMTAEQMHAMVEEDERAWEQARVSEKIHAKSNAAAATVVSVTASASSSGGSNRTDGGRIDASLPARGGGSNDGGWSEVGGGSRLRSSNGGENAGRGRVLSMRNVRAATRASRPSSPCSDPATTTSASSSDCSEGSKDKLGLHLAAADTRGSRVTNKRGPGGRPTSTPHGMNRSATNRAAGNHTTWGAQQSNRGGGGGGGGGGGPSGRATHATRPSHQGRGVSSRNQTRDTSDRANLSRPSRTSNPLWGTARPPPPPRTARESGKLQQQQSSGAQRSAPVEKQPKYFVVAQKSAPSVGAKKGAPLPKADGSAPSTSGSSSQAKRVSSPWNVPQDVDIANKDDALLREPQVSLPSAVPVSASEEVEFGNVKDADEGPRLSAPVPVPAPPVIELPAATPPAWTNTPSHPLGMQPEPTPLPPASEPPCPPPQHQQHWQRQQQRDQQQRQQHQQFFLHQEQQPLVPMVPVPVPQQRQQQHMGGQHFQPPPLPSHQHPHQTPPHELMMPPPPPPPPQFFPSSEEASPPPLVVHMANNNLAAPAPNAVAVASTMYTPHPVHMSAGVASPAVSPSGGNVDPHYNVVREGSYDSPSAGTGGGSARYPIEAGVPPPPPPPQVVMLPPPRALLEQQQQHGRFSPSPQAIVTTAEDGSGGGGPSPPVFGRRPSVVFAPTNPNVVVGGGDEPLETLIGALCWQVEYYFSADNLVKDAYLRGLMDIEGFVPVSKIMVFNRVRSMTSDVSLLIAAMRRSTDLDLLEENHTGEVKVRTRHSPLHWTQEQVPPSSKVPSPPVTGAQREHGPYETEKIPPPFKEEHQALGLGEDIVVTFEPQHEGQE